MLLLTKKEKKSIASIYVVPVTVKYKKHIREVKTFAMLSNSNQVTFVKEDLFEEKWRLLEKQPWYQLNLWIEKTPFSHLSLMMYKLVFPILIQNMAQSSKNLHTKSTSNRQRWSSYTKPTWEMEMLWTSAGWNQW